MRTKYQILAFYWLQLVLIKKLVKLKIKFLITLNILLLKNLISLLQKHANLVSKTGFFSKLIRLNRKITSSKTNYLEAQKKLNGLTTKNYNFFLGRM